MSSDPVDLVKAQGESDTGQQEEPTRENFTEEQLAFGRVVGHALAAQWLSLHRPAVAKKVLAGVSSVDESFPVS